MRRGLAGVLFFVAAVCLALAAGGWWLQRVAFDTDQSADLAAVVLEDAAIRTEIARLTAEATAQTLGVPVAQVQAEVDQRAQTEAGAALARQIIADSHAKLIGLRTEPVQITGAQLVQLTRNEAVGGLPAITLPVEEVGVLSTIRTSLEWAVPIAAIAGAAFLLLGLLAHPRKSDAVFGIGMFCIIAGIVVLLIGYVVPVFLFPVLNDDTWAGVIPAVAADSLPIVLVAAVVLCAGGLVLMFAAAAARRNRSWSSPVPVHRYGDQHRWS
jgi:hypothetical protein